MNVSSKQKTAQQMAGFLKDRRNAQGGYVSIVYKNENGENCTGYCDLMEVELQLQVKEMFALYELEKLKNILKQLKQTKHYNRNKIRKDTPRITCYMVIVQAHRKPKV